MLLYGAFRIFGIIKVFPYEGILKLSPLANLP